MGGEERARGGVLMGMVEKADECSGVSLLER